MSAVTSGSRTYTAYIAWDEETQLYVGLVPGVPGAHTQGATLDELKANLKEVLELCQGEHLPPVSEAKCFTS